MFTDGPPAYRDWNGFRWYYDHRMGRYRNSTGIPLARAVWTHVHGPIPDGYDVHHVDGDKANDDPANLALVEHHEHRNSHAAENGRKSNGNAAGAAAMWAARAADSRICEHCGAAYESRATYSSYCGPNCRAAARRRRHRDALGMG